jgi:CDP-diacylglycerol--glycerol-3-phosphate 3-phosphatidyltransferase
VTDADAPASVAASDAPAVVEVAPAPGVGLLNAANAVTALRMLLVPVFVALLLVDGGDQTRWRLAAAAAFGITSLTDRLDGQIARSRGLITDFGQIADPVADKALTGAALISLSLLGELAWWVTALVVVREIGVTLLRFTVIRHGIIPASRGGKIKTLLQGIAIALYVLPLSGWVASGRAYVMAAAVFVTVVTGVDYVLRAVTLRRTSPRAELKRRRAAEARRPAADETD